MILYMSFLFPLLFENFLTHIKEVAKEVEKEEGQQAYMDVEE